MAKAARARSSAAPAAGHRQSQPGAKELAAGLGSAWSNLSYRSFCASPAASPRAYGQRFGAFLRKKEKMKVCGVLLGGTSGSSAQNCSA